MKRKITTQTLCMTAVLMALVCIATLFFKVPIPLGYAHLGNGVIFLGAFLMGNPEALLIAGVGSAMADLLGGYTEWIIPTLIIKCMMGWAVSYLIHRGSDQAKVTGIRTLAGVITGTIIMVAGYFIAGSVIYGSIAAGAAQIPGLVAEDVVGIVLFYFIAFAMEKSGVVRMVSQRA